MSKRFRNRPVLFVLLGLGLGLLVGLGMMIGTLTALTSQQSAGLTLPPTLLHATASHSGESMAIATGLVDTDVEGLFVLDYLTGELHGYVLYPGVRPRPVIGGVFRHNVNIELGVEQGKKPNYAMVTGLADFRSPGYASCVIYVADANSGNFAVYALPWDRPRARAMTPQKGGFEPIASGRARQIELRSE